MLTGRPQAIAVVAPVGCAWLTLVRLGLPPPGTQALEEIAFGGGI